MNRKGKIGVRTIHEVPKWTDNGLVKGGESEESCIYSSGVDRYNKESKQVDYRHWSPIPRCASCILLNLVVNLAVLVGAFIPAVTS